MSTRPGYGRFINSPEWQAIRQRAFAHYGCKCSRCPSTARLHVHHLTYIRFGGAEQMADLAILCENCHRAEHGMKPLALVKAKKKRPTRGEQRKRKKQKAANLKRAIESGAFAKDAVASHIIALNEYRERSRQDNGQRSAERRRYSNRTFGSPY